MLVGLCVALLVTASAASLLSGNLRDQRDLVLESRLSDALRLTSERAVRELRRAVDARAAAAESGAPAASTGADPADALRLRAGVVEARTPDGRWQALSDAAALTVTQLTLTPKVQDIALADLCATPCPQDASGCPPHQEVRSLGLALTGQLSGEPTLTRSLSTYVRLRNDAVLGHCAP